MYDERRSSYSSGDCSNKGKYLLTGMIRRDSSTKFGPGNKVDIFRQLLPVASDEGFFGESSLLISKIKR
jgi:hypothetical protein